MVDITYYIIADVFTTCNISLCFLQIMDLDAIIACNLHFFGSVSWLDMFRVFIDFSESFLIGYDRTQQHWRELTRLFV